MSFLQSLDIRQSNDNIYHEYEYSVIWLQIRTRRPRIRLYANLGKFGCIISL